MNHKIYLGALACLAVHSGFGAEWNLLTPENAEQLVADYTAREDALAFIDLTSDTGECQGVPSLCYSFGDLHLSPGELSVIAYQTTDEGIKGHYITRDGMSFTGLVDETPLRVDGEGWLPTAVDTVIFQAREEETLPANDVYQVTLASGETLCGRLAQDRIAITDGWKGYRLSTRTLESIQRDAGISGVFKEGDLERSFNSCYVVDGSLELEVNPNQKFVIPWDQISSVRKNSIDYLLKRPGPDPFEEEYVALEEDEEDFFYDEPIVPHTNEEIEELFEAEPADSEETFAVEEQEVLEIPDSSQELENLFQEGELNEWVENEILAKEEPALPEPEDSEVEEPLSAGVAVEEPTLAEAVEEEEIIGAPVAEEEIKPVEELPLGEMVEEPPLPEPEDSEVEEPLSAGVAVEEPTLAETVEEEEIIGAPVAEEEIKPVEELPLGEMVEEPPLPEPEDSEVEEPSLSEPVAEEEMEEAWSPGTTEVAEERPEPIPMVSTSRNSNMVLVPSEWEEVAAEFTDENMLPTIKQPTTLREKAGFYITPKEITNEEYARFVKETGYRTPSHWLNGKFPKGEEENSVVNVTYRDAKAYAKWAGMRLPTEKEWQRAARHARVDPYLRNFIDSNQDNVAEWTESRWSEEPFRAVMQGAMQFSEDQEVADKAPMYEEDRCPFTGFRCVKDH